MAVPWGHIFHENCIKSCLRVSNSCPTCKTRLARGEKAVRIRLEIPRPPPSLNISKEGQTEKLKEAIRNLEEYKERASNLSIENSRLQAEADSARDNYQVIQHQNRIIENEIERAEREIKELQLQVDLLEAIQEDDSEIEELESKQF